MSSASRTGPRSGKGAAKTTDTSGSGSKPQKSDTKTDTPKTDNPKSQPTAEQMRIAQIIETRNEDPELKNKIKQIMDATRKSEDEVCTALHDCDNDLDRAVNMLLEGEAQGEWVTSGNKKKNRHPGATVSSSTRGEKSDNNRDRSEPGESGPDRDRSRTRGGGPPRMRGRGSSDSRGWRGRENKENEKNIQEEGTRDGGPPRRGGGGRMMNGPGRSGRGGRGGRSGPRTFQSRGEKGGPGFPRSIDTWNPHGDAEPAEAPANGPEFAGENWNDDFPSPEDWDNEEYTGSLADTKVFTASANVTPQASAGGANSGLEGRHDATSADLAAVASALPAVSNNSLENAASMLPQSLTAAGLQVAPGQQTNKSLTPAQSQYLTQLTQASLATDNLKAAVGIGSSSVSSNGTKEPVSYVSAVNAGGGYPSNAASTYQTSTPAYTATTVSYAASTYGAATASSAPSYSSQMKGTAAMMSQQQQPQSRPKTQRIRVPPPSKIPASAVEMPGDAANSSISFLDVQFGGLEFGSDSSSFDFPPNNTASSESANKFQSSNAGSGLESNKVGSSVGVPLDLSSMGLTKSSQQSQQQQAQVQQASQQQQTQSQVSGLDGYSSASGNQQSGTTSGQSLASQHSQHSKDLSQQASSLSAMSHSQKLSSTDSMTFPSQVSEHKPQQTSVASTYSQSRAGGGSGNTGSSGLDMVKSEPSSTPSLSYSNSSSSNTNAAYQSSYQKPSSVYQSSTNYSSSAVSSGGAGGYSQGTNTSSTQYQTSQQSQNSGYSSAQTGYNSQATAFPSSTNQPPTTSYSQTSGNPSSYHQSQSASGYQSSSYPSMSQPSSVSSSYQSNQQYQAAAQQQQQQSYSASGGSTSYTPATGSSAASQYQSGYGSNGPVTTATSLHGTSSGSAKLGAGMGSTTSKDSQYDVPNTATGSSLGSANVQGANSVTPSSLGLVSSAGQASTNAASTKVTSSTAGVPQAMMSQHQYIMSQQGMPFYNVQQPIYGFDDYQHQLMQSRVPMQTASGFYDLSSLTAGRESGMTSVAYSVPDGRFARTDNNSSPVPSTLSQQNPTQAHQQPMLNPTTLPPGYAYFYGTGVVPGSFQYGTPTLYQLPTATNAHGATNSTQYAKPATYSSGYGSGYDSLSGQGTADYSKASGGYAASQGGQTSKGSVVGSAGSSTSAAASASDLTTNMYGKAHVALGKVNSYDKQGFHSGTPPPFSLPASQTSQIGAAAAGYTPLFIPTMAPHQQLHQPLHQMEFRNQGRRSDSGSGTGQRSQTTSQQSKTGVKQGYNTSYWAQN